MSDRIASHGDFLMPAGEGAVCETMTASQQQSLLRASVIIPHLNEPDNLRRCLQSLEAQRTSEMPFEIIVVDNGSSELPVAAGSGFDAARLEREPVPGPGPARNLGARLARSELLVFIDADCVAQPGWLRAIVVFMENNPCIGFAGGGIGLLLSNPKRPTSVEAYEHFQLSRSTLRRRYGFAATGNMAVRASVFGAVGPFGGIPSMEDTEWGQRATAQGFQVAYIPDAVVLTPSCKSFNELARRWDRHVAREFRKVDGGVLSIARWLAGCAVVAASPLAEVIRIMRSDHIKGMCGRLLALMCLTRIRLYRAQRMLALALHRDVAAVMGKWNRESS